MPIPFALLQIALCVLAAVSMALLGGKRAAANIWAAIVVIVVVLGLAVERYSDLSWRAMTLGIPWLVYVTNQTPMGAVALTTLMAVRAPNAAAVARSVVLGLTLTCVGVWSLSWLSSAPPANIRGTVDRDGYCPQTSNYTCSAASAAMLLYRFGVPATESEMATLCLTRVKRGTTPLGLYYGVATKAAASHWRAHAVAGITPAQLPTPCLIEVGIKRGVPPDIAARLQKYGWSRNYYHTVCVLRADPQGQWLDVNDPSTGRERWPTQGLNYIWNGDALTLVKR